MKRLLVSPMFLGGLVLALVICLSALLLTQKVTEDSPKGFVLPTGDPLKGKQAFAELGCVKCHTVHGVVFSEEPSVSPDLVVPLGGNYPSAVSYGRLVTSIIHPSESIKSKTDAYVMPDGKSMMPEYMSMMTVEQVVNLVRFLQDHYDVVIPESHLYYPYANY